VAEVLQRKAEHALNFENGNRYDFEMQHAYSRTVRDADGLGSRMKIFEFGCFTGIVSASLSSLGHKVIGSDIHFVLADEQNAAFFASEGVKLWPHDLAVVPLELPSDSFDVIILTEFLKHLNFNPIPLLGEFARILRPGGMVYCATPNLANVHHRINLLRGRGIMNPIEHLVMNLKPGTGMSVGLHWREWTKAEMVQLFAQAGFTLRSHRYGLISANKSGFPRKQLVSAMFALMLSLMPNQVAVFAR
jgi:2-polyprenyl-3-methyl-5-hydroxy-6-metoxy-1,4-benzoquinol methylase